MAKYVPKAGFFRSRAYKQQFARVATATVNLRRGGMSVGVFLEVPAKLKEMSDRAHNKITKDSLRDVLEYHHKHHMPLHFKGQASAAKYGYMQRKPGYEKAKRRQKHHAYPLVWSGQTARNIKAGYKYLRVGGAAIGGRALNAYLVYQFSFSAAIRAAYAARSAATKKTGDKPNDARKRLAARAIRKALVKQRAQVGVTIAQMKKEIAAMTPEERKKLAEVFKAGYMARFNALPRGRRRIKRA